MIMIRLWILLWIKETYLKGGKVPVVIALNVMEIMIPMANALEWNVWRDSIFGEF